MSAHKGILSHCKLPNTEFDALWERIIVPKDLKEQLISQILLEFTVQREIERGALSAPPSCTSHMLNTYVFITDMNIVVCFQCHATEYVKIFHKRTFFFGRSHGTETNSSSVCRGL
jgi:hypothetical protein